MFETEENPNYKGLNRYVVHDNPQLTGRPIEGIAGGRIVAYWPTDDEASCGLRSLCAGYIPAMIVASWQNPGSVPTNQSCNLRLFADQANCFIEKVVPELAKRGQTSITGETKCSAQYSEVPAKGCWTWIPKA